MLVIAVLAVLIIGVPTLVASHYAKQYFLFSPGTAPVITASDDCKASSGELALPNGTPCVHLVLPKGKAHDVEGRLLMVDVEVSQATPLDWAEFQLGLLGNQRQLVPVAAYAGPTPTSELGCQDTQEMVSANQDAAIAALQSLHYQVTEVPLGAEVNTVYASTPAWDAGIKCDDLITAVNGHRVSDAAALTSLLGPMKPGTMVTLTDKPASGGPPRLIKVRLLKPPANRVAEGFDSPAYLGVSVDTRVKPKFPFTVSVDAGDIGGPSAGLAFTLAILDALSNGKLTGGHIVAATGTISTNGDVGDVGGVQEKTAAVEKAGAQVFFVPAVEYTNAESVADKRLKVVPVTTLTQVLQILQRDYGGSVPTLGSQGTGTQAAAALADGAGAV
jgi:PDZ domain-containing protein